MLLASNDHEHTDDELAEAVPMLQLVLMLVWLVPALVIAAPVAAIAALLARPKRHDPLFVDPIEAVRVLDGEGTA
jgi:hypothetical protein